MKTKATILIDDKVLQTAHEIGINVSKFCEYALTQGINAIQNLDFQNTRFLGPASLLQTKSMVRSPGFEPGIASLEGLCPNQPRRRPPSLPMHSVTFY